MATSPQTQAINTANEIINVAGQLKALYDLATLIQAQWTDNAVANTPNAQATAVVNADGSTGAVDGTPNVAHQITNSNLVRSLSANQITSMKTVLDTFVSMVNGNAVSATPGIRAILNSATG